MMIGGAGMADSFQLNHPKCKNAKPLLATAGA
jgi:hypothetical protein